MFRASLPKHVLTFNFSQKLSDGYVSPTLILNLIENCQMVTYTISGTCHHSPPILCMRGNSCNNTSFKQNRNGQRRDASLEDQTW